MVPPHCSSHHRSESSPPLSWETLNSQKSHVKFQDVKHLRQISFSKRGEIHVPLWFSAWRPCGGRGWGGAEAGGLPNQNVHLFFTGPHFQCSASLGPPLADPRVQKPSGSISPGTTAPTHLTPAHPAKSREGILTSSGGCGEVGSNYSL